MCDPIVGGSLGISTNQRRDKKTAEAAAAQQSGFAKNAAARKAQKERSFTFRRGQKAKAGGSGGSGGGVKTTNLGV